MRFGQLRLARCTFLRVGPSVCLCGAHSVKGRSALCREGGARRWAVGRVAREQLEGASDGNFKSPS